jgi:hypothetical protein
VHQQVQLMRVIDLVNNHVQAQFSARADTMSFLYKNAGLVAQQQMDYRPIENTPAYKVFSTPQFRVIDTQTEKIQKEVTLERDYGKAQKLVCKDTKPTLILQHAQAQMKPHETPS